MRHLLIVVLLLNFAFAKAQNYWLPVEQQPTEDLENRRFIPEDFSIYNLDLSGLQQAVAMAPKRFTVNTSSVILTMPSAQGSLKDFEVFETVMMEPALYTKYAQIRTYIGVALNDRANVIRFSITPHGFHNIEFVPGEPTVYTEPFTLDHTTYIVYDRSSLPEIKENYECLTDEEAFNSLNNNVKNLIPKAADDSSLRTYRIAISCNAEYGNIFAGNGTDAQKRANILAQQVITMNRVNGVFERDLAINMIFVANNDVLLYFGDTFLDPYDTDFNGRTQDLIDGNLSAQGFPGIGNGFYDIGHNFNTSGGGNAGCIGCVCSSGQKGSGMTGQANPTGDPFDIDYVAHEIGHQFGGFHSMASGNCRSGSGQTEVEPGSGSTIMAYAGICAPNVQNNSNDYFHYVNIRDILANVKTGTSSSCAAVTNVSLTAPIANAGADYTIPYGTAFVLTGTATNLGTETVTYNWEQNDPENPNSILGPDPMRVQGPMYRSRPSSTVPTRYFPELSQVIQGNLTPQFEMTPSVARDMEFAFTARKYNMNIGQNDSDLMNITVDGNTGPFEVISQDANVSYNTGEAAVINWNVAGTDLAPINTSTVDILMSTDGGVTFSTIIASAVPNDGSETVIIPTVPATTQARFMVRANGNVYYAVNAADFTITNDDFSLSSTELVKEVCLPNNAVYNFTYTTFNGFNAPTTLSLTGAPAGANVTISPSTVTSDNTPVTITVSGLTTAMIGSYTLSFEGIGGTTTRSTGLTLNVLDTNLAATTLVLPLDNEVDVALSPLLEWNTVTGAQEYTIEIAADSSFTNIIETATITGNAYTVSITLDEDTVYYWRVQSSNACGVSNFSNTRSFRTSNIICFNEAANAVPAIISDGPPSSQDSIITITSDVVINDIVLNIDISHTWMSDLDIYLTSPLGTQITIVEDRCGFRNDMLATFSDDGAAINCSGSAPTINGTVLPVDMLSTFIGESSIGNWTLTVADDTNNDGGTLNAWSLDICGVQTLANTEMYSSQIALYPNPASDLVQLDLGNLAFAKAELQVYDLLGKFIMSQNIETAQSNIAVQDWASGVYLMKIEIDGQSLIKKFIKN